MRAKLCPTLCDTKGCSPPGSSDHWILQARILEWVAISSPGDLPFPTQMGPGSLTCPALAGGFFTTSAPWELVVICYINQKLIQQEKTFLIGILKSQIMGKKSNLAFPLDLRK